MINVNEAQELMQKRNGTCWFNAALERLNDEIVNSAKEGLSSVEINISDMIIGAENLYEIRELLANIENGLKEKGFKSKVSLEGDLIISW